MNLPLNNFFKFNFVNLPSLVLHHIPYPDSNRILSRYERIKNNISNNASQLEYIKLLANIKMLKHKMTQLLLISPLSLI